MVEKKGDTMVAQPKNVETTDAFGQEMSMDEILTSIRKIISDDQKPGSSSFLGKESAAPKSQGGILDLKNPLQPSDESKPSQGFQASLEAHNQRLARTQNSQINQPHSTGRAYNHSALPPVPSATATPASRRTLDVSLETSSPLLMSSETQSVSSAVLQKLAQSPKILVSGNQSQTLEDMIQELSKPLLRAWMDAHLASLVERVVREQIQLLLNQKS